MYTCPSGTGTSNHVGSGLAFTKYSFTLRLLCTNQSSFSCPLPPAFPTLVQYYCTAIAQ